jgi:hypothetical protein
MDILPNADKAVIPARKFTEYALSFEKDPDKAWAFQAALGYNRDNAGKLTDNIRRNITMFPAKHKGSNAYGELYEVIMELTGENGKKAKVLTAWLDDKAKNELRLISAYVDD